MELENAGLRFRPHCWLADEWFSPDGIPGIAIPFYLSHPRLRRLERRMMREVEGGNTNWMMRILRHEAGHAIDTAFRLRRRKAWRQVFGPASRRYPTRYSPRPGSRRHVLHLGHWYAQSHPAEDFAETFAVWLTPRSAWRRDYAGWPALAKLEYVDATMHELRGRRPPNQRRERIEPLAECRRTLREHYRRKVENQQLEIPESLDRRLLRVFGRPESWPRRATAARFLREVRPQLHRLLVRRARMHPYVVDHVLTLATLRVSDLDLRLKTSREETKRHALRMLESTMLEMLIRNRENFAL
jgi:hypothetical protein